MAYLKAAKYADDLLHIFGRGRVFFDKEILQIYAHDLSNPPWIIDYLVRRQPDAVCVAENRDQVVKLLQYANANRIPVTPAAGRTSGYGGAVPTKGGIVLDLTRLNQKIQVDAASLTVTVDPGVVIWNLEQELNRHNLTLLSYPTSAPSATIGGFVCQGGVGMGAWREGPVANQVQACEIVLPNGDVKQFSGADLDVVNECEGVTGVVTQVTLRVAPKVERVPVLAVYDSLDALAKGLEAITQSFNPWNVTFHNPTFSQFREEAGGPKTVPRKKWSILATFDKPDFDQSKAEIHAALEGAGGKLLPEATAKADWGEIFNTLRAKALGPSIAPGECVFPLYKIREVLDEVDAKFEYAPLSMEGTLIRGGNVTLLAFALDDERRPEYPLGFAAGIGVMKAAQKHGGRAYAPGLYLAAEAPKVFGARRYDRISAFKKAVDPQNIMNPGKIFGGPVRAKALLLGIPPIPRWAAPPGAPMATVDRVLNAAPIVWLMGKLAPLVKYNRPADDRAARPAMFKAMDTVQAGAFGRTHGWAVYSCSQCGFCRNVSPLTGAVGFEAGSPSGLLWWARLNVQGKLRPTKKIAEMVAAAAETYVGDDVCPSRIPISQVMKDWRSQLEADYRTKFVVPASLRDRIKQQEAALAEQKKRWGTPAAPAAAPAAPAAPPASASPAAAKRPVPAAAPAPPAGPKPAAA